MSPGPARSSVAMPAMRTEPSPSSAAPTDFARSARECNGGSLWWAIVADASQGCLQALVTCAGSLVGKRLDHLVGDVDALTGVDHRVLENQIELLVGGDLLDDLVRALLDAGELFVAAQVQVLAEFALHALQIARLVGEVPLLVAALGFGHRRA